MRGGSDSGGTSRRPFAPLRHPAVGLEEERFRFHGRVRCGMRDVRHVGNSPMKKRTLGNSDMQITPVGLWRLGGGVGAGNLGWGKQDDRRLDCGDPSRAGTRRELDRHGGGVRARPFGRSRGAGAGGLEKAPRPYVFTKCGIVDKGGGEVELLDQARLDPPRGRGEPAPVARGRDRSLSTSLARR